MKTSFLFAISSCLMLAGCAASVPPVVYEPIATDSVFSFYQNGYALGTVGNDSCRVVAELEYARVAGDDYVRLWLLYYNSSNHPFFLDPMNVARITTIDSTDTFDSATHQWVRVPDTLGFDATPPYRILSSIGNQQAITEITQAILGGKKALEEPTTVTNTQTGEQWQVNKSTSTVAYTSMIYDLYKQSVIAGILRRNTVFPNQNVTGYIYFKAPFGPDYPGIANVNLHVKILTQTGTANFDFKPVAGE